LSLADRAAICSGKKEADSTAAELPINRRRVFTQLFLSDEEDAGEDDVEVVEDDGLLSPVLLLVDPESFPESFEDSFFEDSFEEEPPLSDPEPVLDPDPELLA
jgi:hypothetical protein